MSRQPGPWDLPAEPDSPPDDEAAVPPPAGREVPVDPRDAPAFNAPWPVLLLTLSMPALYWFQARGGDPIGPVQTWGLVPARVMQGDWTGLIGAMLLHGGWAHVAMNAVGALAFGTAVVRLFDRRTGVLGFVSFYAICGILSGLGYVALHPASQIPLVGASGAVFGLIGASTRLVGRRGLAPMFERRVISQMVMWTVLNVAIGLAGSLMAGVAGGAVAWEAHIAGLIVGWLLVGPFARVFARARG